MNKSKLVDGGYQNVYQAKPGWLISKLSVNLNSLSISISLNTPRLSFKEHCTQE